MWNMCAVEMWEGGSTHSARSQRRGGSRFICEESREQHDPQTSRTPVAVSTTLYRYNLLVVVSKHNTVDSLTNLQHSTRYAICDIASSVTDGVSSGGECVLGGSNDGSGSISNTRISVLGSRSCAVSSSIDMGSCVTSSSVNSSIPVIVHISVS
uniref:Long neurotoxin 1 n=1 Tax=Lygus hesperus TaxID=30085 RepID=A0A0A9YBG7_LYGHE